MKKKLNKQHCAFIVFIGMHTLKYNHTKALQIVWSALKNSSTSSCSNQLKLQIKNCVQKHYEQLPSIFAIIKLECDSIKKEIKLLIPFRSKHNHTFRLLKYSSILGRWQWNRNRVIVMNCNKKIEQIPLSVSQNKRNQFSRFSYSKWTSAHLYLYMCIKGNDPVNRPVNILWL